MNVANHVNQTNSMTSTVPMLIAHAPTTTDGTNATTTTLLPISLGNMYNQNSKGVDYVNYMYNQYAHVPSESMFSNYMIVAVILAMIVGASIYTINPPQVQKTCIGEPLIEQSPHFPTIFIITL